MDFEAADNEPAKIIVLLLTPKNENELRLKLLAEAANLFADISHSEEIINSESPEEILAKINKIKSRME